MNDTVPYLLTKYKHMLAEWKREGDRGEIDRHRNRQSGTKKTK